MTLFAPDTMGISHTGTLIGAGRNTSLDLSPVLILYTVCRYIDWLVTTPLLILDLGLLAGQDVVTISAVMGADSTFLSLPSLP